MSLAPDSPDASLLQCICGNWVQQAVYVLAKFHIPDILHEKPKASTQLIWKEISEREKAKEKAKSADRDFSPSEFGEGLLERVLLVMSSPHVGVLERQKAEDGASYLYSNTPLSNLLRPSVPRSLYHFCLLSTEVYGPLWSELYGSIRSGVPATELVYGSGKHLYDYLEKHDQQSQLFDAAMAELSQAAIETLHSVLPKPSAESGKVQVVDIGGGNGSLARRLVSSSSESSNSIRVLVLDRPDTVRRALENPVNTEVLSNASVTFQGCDAFAPNGVSSALPEGTQPVQAFIVKNVIHDWGDEDCVKLLSNVHAAMKQQQSSDSVLIIMERLIRPTEEQPGLLFDAIFQRLIGGKGCKERDGAAMKALLEKAGFKIQATHPLKSGHSIIVAVPE